MTVRPSSPKTVDEAASDEPRFIHTKRPDWGEAVVIDRRPDRCTLQFADGIERTIGKRFYHLITKVVDEQDEQPGDAAAAANTGIEIEADDDDDAEAPSEQLPAEEEGVATMGLEGQIRVFRTLYPAGFEDSGYRDRYRVRRDGDRSKRHVDPLLAAAAHQLGRKAFDRPRAKRSPADVHKAVIDLLETTSLVAPSDMATPLADYNRRRLTGFATALRNLLYGMQGFDVRLERWVEVLRHGGMQRVNWTMVTLLPALLHPRELLLVRPNLLQRFGANLGQGDRLFRSPSAEGWLWYAKVAAVAQAELTVADLEPNDLFDVLTFASVTLGKEGAKVWEDLQGAE